MRTIKKLVLFALLTSATVTFLMGCEGTGIPIAPVTGTITINGKPAQGVNVKFVPQEKIRPSEAVTDAQGRYKAQFVSRQSGVALGPCVVQLSIFRGGNYMHNYLPPAFNVDAEKNPDLKLDVPEAGIVFDYDIQFDGKIPPYSPE